MNLLISESVYRNRCAGCGLEDLKDTRYLLFSGVSIDYDRGDIYAFCPICAHGHLKATNIGSSGVEVSKEFITVAMVMGS